MGYYISHMIGIRVGGIFSGDVDIDDVKERIKKIVLDMQPTDDDPDMGKKNGDVSHCMSQELRASKGSYIVLAGVFNYWDFNRASLFVKKLSEEFQTEVMHMAWNEMQDDIQCEIWLAGKPYSEINEYPLNRTFRRLT